MEVPSDVATETSKVFQDRIELINELENFTPSQNDLCKIVEDFITFWEESPCHGIPHCMCNVQIMHKAQQYLQSVDSCDIFCQFIVLSIKATKWCRIHFTSLFAIVKDPNDDHLMVFIELLLGSLHFASAIYSDFMKNAYLSEDYFLERIEELISEHFSLIKLLISDIKKMLARESEILKAIQELLEAITIISENLLTLQKAVPLADCKEELLSHFVNMTSCTIQNLYDLGVLAATGTKNLIGILNISWKTIVTLLQSEALKGFLPGKVNIRNIVLTLISLATDSLKLLSKIWFLSQSECKVPSITDTEARRALIPIKFYLRNALQISYSYPCEIFKVERDIVSCTLRFSTVCALLGMRDDLKIAYETLTKTLEPLSQIFTVFLLKANEAGIDFRLRILDELFPKITFYPSREIIDLLEPSEVIIEELFSSKPADSSLILLGRVRLLLNLFQRSAEQGPEIRLAISRRLDWLLDAISQADTYVVALQATIKVASSDATTKLNWSFMFLYILQAVKTFFIFNASTTAWTEVEAFLFRNIIHPHPLCWMLVLELWCFVVRHAQLDMVEKSIDALCSLVRSLAHQGSSCSMKSLRKLSRALSVILKHVPQQIVERSYHDLSSKDGIAPERALVIITSLIQEGFPLYLLTETSRAHALYRIVEAFTAFTNTFLESRARCSSPSDLFKESIYCLPHILSHSEMKKHVKEEVIIKIPKLALGAMEGLKCVNDNVRKYHYRDILICALEMVSYIIQSLRTQSINELLITLDSLLTAGGSSESDQWTELKPSVALFLASLSAVAVPEDEGNAVSRSVWNLYHFILRERHWGGIHLGLASFGEFAACSSCNELWRFVPLDAALSFDKEYGKQCTAELFMSELKLFLEKDGAMDSLSIGKDEMSFLRREAFGQSEKWKSLLHGSEQLFTTQNEQDTGNNMVVDSVNSMGQKTKSDGIKEGTSLIRQGLSLLTSHLKRWDHDQNSSMHKDRLANQVSRLSEILDQMEGAYNR